MVMDKATAVTADYVQEIARGAEVALLVIGNKVALHYFSTFFTLILLSLLSINIPVDTLLSASSRYSSSPLSPKALAALRWHQYDYFRHHLTAIPTVSILAPFGSMMRRC